MTDWALIAALLGALSAAGVVLMVVAVRGTRREAAPRGRRAAALRRAMAPKVTDTSARARRRLLLLAVGAGLLVWLLSGWPMLGLFAAAAVVVLPLVFGSGRRDKRRIEKYEALEDWVRRVTSTYASGVGLTTALVQSQRQVQPAIMPHVRALASRLSARMDTTDALRAFADDFDDPLGDLAAAALMQISALHGTGSAAVLSALADTIAEEVVSARRIETERATPRMTVRIVIIVAVGMAIAMGLLTDYLAPYGTPGGQLFLGLVMILAIGCMAWMWTKTTPVPDPRFLRDVKPSRWRS